MKNRDEKLGHGQGLLYYHRIVESSGGASKQGMPYFMELLNYSSISRPLHAPSRRLSRAALSRIRLYGPH